MRASVEGLQKAFGLCFGDKQLRHIGGLEGHEEILLYIADLRFNSSDIVIKHHAYILFICHRNSDDCLRLASNRVAQVTTVDSSELHISCLHHLIEEAHKNLIGFFNKRYLKKLQTPKAGGPSSGGGFGDVAMTAMFIGLVSAYIGSYLGKFVSGEGLFTFAGPWLPLAVAAVAAAVMAVFVWLAEKKNAAWVESFSIAGSMIAAMAAAVVLNLL